MLLVVIGDGLEPAANTLLSMVLGRPLQLTWGGAVGSSNEAASCCGGNGEHGRDGRPPIDRTGGDILVCERPEASGR